MTVRPVDGNAAAKIESLTGLRAVAAALVFLMHLQVLPRGYLGVDLFFALSGFVLCHVYHAQFATGIRGYRRFMALRLGRLYPAYLVVLALWLSALAAADILNLPHETQTQHGLLVFSVAYALMVQAWGLFAIHDFNRPAWSVSVEWLLYLVFPLLVRPLLRLRRLEAVLLVAVLLIAVRVALLQGTDDARFTDIGRGVCGFLLGMLVWRAGSGGLSARAAGVLADGGMIALMALMILPGTHALIDHAAFVVMVLLIFGLARQSGLIASLLSRPLPVYLGEISYGFYLLQILMLAAVWAGWDWLSLETFAPRRIWFGPVAAIATLIAATAIYHLVERPVRAAVRERCAQW